MKHLVFFLAAFSILTSTKGQIINSMAADRSGMYYYSLDSLTKMIPRNIRVDKMILLADKASIFDFPDSINGIAIQVADKKFKPKNLKRHEVLVRFSKLEIIRAQVELSLFTLQKIDRSLDIFEDGAYVFKYYYIPESKSYKLKYLYRGMH